MTEESAPLFRVCHVNTEKGGAFVNISLWDGELFCGMLRMMPESYAILQSILELGRRAGKVEVRFDNLAFIYDTEQRTFTRKEWSSEAL